MFSTSDGGRTGRSPLQFFDPKEVPDFEGAEAWFAVTRVRGGSRIVKVLEQVEPPAWAEAEKAKVPPSREHVPFSTPSSRF